MSIIIKGMEMPKVNEILVFDMWHGKIYARSITNIGSKFYEVVPLPEGHGRLIDADALNDVLIKLADNEYSPKVFASWLTYEENAPTIVPAEGDANDGA